MSWTAFDEWLFHTEQRRQVTILRRYLSIEDTCPECGGGIRVAVAKVGQRLQVFRLECLDCGWTTEALPDPESD